jgi:cysteine desulfurase/selenocysteine lyase
MKNYFPIFHNQPQLVYLDNAATTQKPDTVIQALSDFYSKFNANVGRSSCHLGDHATELYEKAREKVKNFLNAQFSEEIIFTRSTTEGLNLLAHILTQNLEPEDEVILTEVEHHSNLIPWQLVAKNKKLKLKFVPIKPDGELDLEVYKQLFTKKTKIVSISHLSNVLGNLINVKEMIQIAKQNTCFTIVDGAQAVSKIKVDVQELVDFYVFSGHKIYGPTGIGVLYGKKELLKELPAYQVGGKTINEVYTNDFTLADLPNKYEAGTPNIAGAIALGEAINFVQEHFDTNPLFLETDRILFKHEKELTDWLISALQEIDLVHIFGDQKNKLGLISFSVKGIHPLDIATILSKYQICVRIGHHCAMPLVKKLDPRGVIRVSLGVYNTLEDCQTFITTLKKTIKLLKK